MNDLILSSDIQVKVTRGSIDFPEYELLKRQAIEVAEFVGNIEVSEENVKQAKKLLATVNKSVKSLEDRRISIKKEMLEPYNDFETQVKEIVKIVKDADTLVRNQVKELDEQERENKKVKINDIWNKRINHYDFDFVDFEQFLTPSHLNKSTSLSKVEDEMVQWLEKINSDLEVIENLPNKKEVLQEYIENLDLTVSMLIVNERKEKENKVEEFYKEEKENIYQFIIFNEKDAKLTEMLLKENDIKFEKK